MSRAGLCIAEVDEFGAGWDSGRHIANTIAVDHDNCIGARGPAPID